MRRPAELHGEYGEAVFDEVRPGLYRWTAPHPAWKPAAPETVDAWPEEVGCVAYATPGGGMLLVDPLVGEEMWHPLDRLLAQHGPPLTVTRTLRWHGRSIEDVARRYSVTETPAADVRVKGVDPLPVAGADETMLWLSEPRALVVGDRLLGDGRGGLRICPQSWLDYIEPSVTVDELRERLRPLLELPVEAVLVSHGEPVLSDGGAALAAALA